MSEPTPDADDVTSFVLSKADIWSRHYNVGLGLLLGIGLSIVASWGYGAESAEPNALVPLVANLFVAIFGTYVLVSHLRYVYNSRRHHLDVTPETITFRTGFDTSSLRLADVVDMQRERRLREGPSLKLQLVTSRFVRLVGYEDQERLMALVEKYVERARAARKQD